MNARSMPAAGGYQTALRSLALMALACVALGLLGWLWPPRWNGLLALQRLDSYKQVTGYVLVALLAFDLCLALIKRRLRRSLWQRTLQLSHRILGVLMLIVLVLHSGFSHTGFLQAAFVLTLTVVLLGGVINLIPPKRLATWGQWTIATHITLACLLGAVAVMHLYFIYRYAS